MKLHNTNYLDGIMNAYLDAEKDYREASRKVSDSRERLSDEVSKHYLLDSRKTTQLICYAKRCKISIHSAYLDIVWER